MNKNPHVTVKVNTEESCIPFTQFPTSVVKYYKAKCEIVVRELTLV
jgi:hypothetical protein